MDGYNIPDGRPCRWQIMNKREAEFGAKFYSVEARVFSANGRLNQPDV
jgi:hypothetical protein